MLILTRRVGESVVIGEDVTVTVLGVKGNQVRIGINAPKTVAVHREEIFARTNGGRRGPGQRGFRADQQRAQCWRRRRCPGRRSAPPSTGNPPRLTLFWQKSL